MDKHTALETWTALEDFAMDQVFEEVMAMTDDECVAELRAAGFDINAVYAKADALAPYASRSGTVTALRPKRGRLAVAVPVAVALAAGVALVLGTGQPQHQAVPQPVGHGVPEGSRARDLREKARS